MPMGGKYDSSPWICPCTHLLATRTDACKQAYIPNKDHLQRIKQTNALRLADLTNIIIEDARHHDI